MSEVCIKGRDKLLHPTIFIERNYPSLSLIPASDTSLLIYPTKQAQGVVAPYIFITMRIYFIKSDKLHVHKSRGEVLYMQNNPSYSITENICDPS